MADDTATRRAPALSGMVAISCGTFVMGSDGHYAEEAPAHRVTVRPASLRPQLLPPLPPGGARRYLHEPCRLPLRGENRAVNRVTAIRIGRDP
jgi:hypothetical protein